MLSKIGVIIMSIGMVSLGSSALIGIFLGPDVFMASMELGTLLSVAGIMLAHR